MDNTDWERTDELTRALDHDTFVSNVREVTTGDEIDAAGQPLDISLIQDGVHELRKRVYDTGNILCLMHPGQMYVLRTGERHLVQTDETPGIDHSTRVVEMGNAICLIDRNLPPAAVYVTHPDAVSLSGKVIRPNEIVRITGLQHPDTDSE